MHGYLISDRRKNIIETVVEVKETAMAGPKQYGMNYENRTLTLFGLTPEAANAIVRALGVGTVTPAGGTGDYARHRVAFPIDKIGVAAYTPERETFGRDTLYKGPAMIVQTADRTKEVIITGVRTPVKWLPSSSGTPGRY